MKLENVTAQRSSKKRAYHDACGMAHGLELLGDRWALFIVRELHVRYLKPAVLDDELGVTTAIEHLGFVSLTLEQRVMRGGEMLVHASVNLACVSADVLKPMRVPPHVRTALEEDVRRALIEQEDA